MGQPNLALMLVSARDTAERSATVLADLEAKLQKANIPPDQQPIHKLLTNAIWTLDGRIMTVGNMPGTELEKVFSINEAMEAAESATASAQQVIQQLP